MGRKTRKLDNSSRNPGGYRVVLDTCHIEVRVFEKASEKFVFDEQGVLIESTSPKTVEQLTDYKFFCFDGKVKAMFIATDRADETTETKFDFFDENFNHLDIIQGHPNANVMPSRPASFELMKEMASKLSKGIPQVRVDFYEVGNQIYVGELTLFHFSGNVPFKPEEWDQKFGSWIELPDKI